MPNQVAATAEDWARRAQETLESAQALRAAGQDWPNVYHLAGQAIEFMFKAILEKQILRDHATLTHDLRKLATRAGLLEELDGAAANVTALGTNWLIVRGWQSNARFPDMHVTDKDAHGMIRAAANPTAGVMQWLKVRYQSL